MSCECTNTLDLGCFNACDTIAFGTAAQTGNFVVIYSAMPGDVRVTTLAGVAAASLEYVDDGTVLQAGYTYTTEITNPDGTAFTVLSGGTTYDCFEFTINRTITIA